jgi:multiple sugar transport system substrate-binding protein
MTFLSRRRLLVGLGLAVVGPVLQACGQAAPTATPAPAKPAEAPKAAAPAPTQAPAAAPAPTPTTAPAAAPKAAGATGKQIQASTRGGLDGEAITKNGKDFEEKTGIKVEHVNYGGEPEYWAKVQTLHATKQLADLVWSSTGNLHNLANRGILTDLGPLITADKYDMSDFIKAGLDSLSLAGKLYGLPWGGHPGNGGLLYNADMLSAAGFKVTDDPDTLMEWTMDTLMDAAAKTTKESGGRTEVFGFMPGTDFLSMNNFVGAWGARFFSEDGKKLTMDTPEFLKSFNFVRDIRVTKKASPAPDQNGSELFASGKLAMLQTGYWGQFDPGEKGIAGKFKWSVGLMPKGPAGKRGTALTINGQTLSTVGQKKDETFQFLKYIMEPDVHLPIVLTGGSRPAIRKKELENERLMKEMKAHKVFAKGIAEAEPWQVPANYRWVEFSTTVSQVFGDVWAGKTTVEAAMPEATRKLQAVLDKPAID